MASFLLVDGDRNFRETLAIALRLDGHEVVVAPSPDAALAMLRTGAPDACVVDSHLVAADELLDAAAASARTVLLATGRYPELLAAAAIRHPRARTIAKPFRAAEIAAYVRAQGASAA